MWQWGWEGVCHGTRGGRGSGDGRVRATAHGVAGAAGKQIRMGTEGDGALSGDLKAHTCEDHGRVQKTSSKQTHSRGRGQEASGHEVGGRAQGLSWGSFSPGKVGVMAGSEQDSE